MDIICISSQPWNDDLWTNKQHIMFRLSQNNRVLYIDPPIRFLSYLRRCIIGEYKPSSLWDYLIQKNKNLWSGSLVLFGFNKFSFLSRIDLRLKIILIKKMINKLQFKDVILWIYFPLDFELVGRLKESFVIYDCVDEYIAFPEFSTAKSKKKIRTSEKKLIEKADLVLTTSQPLYEAKRLLGKHVHLVHNVGDALHFAKALAPDVIIPADIKKIPHPIIGFIGALSSYKVDFNLLAFLADLHPEWSIVLIGPNYTSYQDIDILRLKDKKNIYLFGVKKYTILPNYIAAFNVCIIPYCINEYTKYCFPLKFYEFMATGKPIVVTNLPSLKSYNRELIYMAHSKEEFARFIELSLKENNRLLRIKRIKEAQKNTWEDRIQNILSLIECYKKDCK